MENLTTQEKETIEGLRKKYSKEIKVKVSLCEESGFCAEILDFPGAVTQGETLSELVEMVNDCVATILEIPEKYLKYMPTYTPPISLFQRFNIFPMPKVEVIEGFSIVL